LKLFVMKKIYFLIILFSVFIVSCRKYIKQEEGNVKYHCVNNVQDFDEIGIDCGGQDCEPCNQTISSCSLPDNELKIKIGAYVNTLEIINHEIDTSDFPYWTFRAY